MLIPLYNFDSLCPKNGQKINFYCNDCKKNLCTFCINEHSKHKIESCSKILVKNNEINDIKNKIKYGKNYIRLIYIFTLRKRMFIFSSCSSLNLYLLLLIILLLTVIRSIYFL